MHQWTFKARFRKRGFGWKSQPAVQRVKEAVREIKAVARKDPVLAGEGAVLFLERVAPAIESVDGSSGSMGSAVNRAVGELASIIASAPADSETRDSWLERLWAAYEADEKPYIERLGDHWGEVCASTEVASAWADRLLDRTRVALSPEATYHQFFRGTSPCLSALYRAGRHPEIVELASGKRLIWFYKRWVVKALAALGRVDEAISLAKPGQGLAEDYIDAARICEEILCASGQVEEAYQRYGLAANSRGTYLATFRALATRYPHKKPAQILEDLARRSAGEEGKWFAAAKDEGLYREAIDLATRAPCDPRTLTRAASDFAADQPHFATDAGLLALHWILEGHGHEIDGPEVHAAWTSTIAAAERCGRQQEVRNRVREMCSKRPGYFADILERQLRR